MGGDLSLGAEQTVPQFSVLLELGQVSRVPRASREEEARLRNEPGRCNDEQCTHSHTHAYILAYIHTYIHTRARDVESPHALETHGTYMTSTLIASQSGRKPATRWLPRSQHLSPESSLKITSRCLRMRNTVAAPKRSWSAKERSHFMYLRSTPMQHTIQHQNPAPFSCPQKKKKTNKVPPRFKV